MTHRRSVRPEPRQFSFSRRDLERALEERAFALHYQPILNLADFTVSGFEALLRWRHPELGLLGPSHVIPLAEHCGLIRELDDWALETACRQLAAWQHDVLVAPGFGMAVNVSGAEMDGDALVERVRRSIDRSGVDPRGIVLEITETHRIESPSAARRSADGLHALGVALAADDFGSQYATFSCLNSLPFDILKIDRPFIAASNTLAGQAFVRALVDLGGGLGTRVIAEGIETAAQAAQMRALGCDEGQGFLWAPGLQPADAEMLLGTGVWPPRDTASSWCPELA